MYFSNSKLPLVIGLVFVTKMGLYIQLLPGSFVTDYEDAHALCCFWQGWCFALLV
jgi:hypothetical protein